MPPISLWVARYKKPSKRPGGTMPEDLPVADSIKEIEAKRKKRLPGEEHVLDEEKGLPLENE
jgi:hypothetical protein